MTEKQLKIVKLLMSCVMCIGAVLAVVWIIKAV